MRVILLYYVTHSFVHLFLPVRDVCPKPFARLLSSYPRSLPNSSPLDAQGDHFDPLPITVLYLARASKSTVPTPVQIRAYQYNIRSGLWHML